MTRLSYIILGAIAVSLASCGTTRKATYSQPQTQQQSTQQKKILYPTNHNEKDDFYVDDKTTASAEKSSSKTSTQKGTGYPAYEITFRPIETEHVKISGVNPLPESGILEVDLDKLKNDFCYPYKGEFLSDYGMRGRAMHTGVDIRTVPNDTVRAALPGVVRMSKLYSGYGNIVVIRHYCGFETVYSHFSKNLVNSGDKVEAGTPIGLGGRTGRATTEHVHFELRAAGQHVDPKKLLDIKNQTIQKGKLYFESKNGNILAYNTQAERDQAFATNQKPETNVPVENAAVKNKPESATSNSSATPASTAQYHTVKSGDTLYGIALKYKTTVKNLCKLNNITEKSLLQINQKVRVK